MTIKQISTILPKPIIISLENIKEKKIAIDTSIFLYKYKYGKPENQEFVSGFKHLVKQFKKYQIEPIFVFDGKPPPLKIKVLEARKKHKETNENAIKITIEDIDALKEYFNTHNILYTVAPGEAEKHCVYLEHTNKVDYILSNDFDVFLFGGKNLIRVNKNIYELYTWENIEKHLELSRQEFQMMAISIGFDYLPSGIPGFGPKKSLKYVKENKTLPPHNISKEVVDEIYSEFEIEFKEVEVN